MKINWDKYKEVIADIESERIQDMIHQCVERYLFMDMDDIRVRASVELKSLGLLEEDHPIIRNIVEPFNFTGDGRA